MTSYILFENCVGFSLFRIKKAKLSISAAEQEHQKSLLSVQDVREMVEFESLAPFRSPADGLKNANSISEGQLTDYLVSFLGQLKDKDCKLGVVDLAGLGRQIKEQLGVSCYSDQTVKELIRAIRYHYAKLVEQGPLQFSTQEISAAQMGLGHAYSRSKVKFNINKSDNMIIQSVATVDVFDKDINTYCMRIREWYGYHFPELSKLVADHRLYVNLVNIIGDRATLSQKSHLKEDIMKETKDEELTEKILNAATSSTGFDLSEIDRISIEKFSKRVKSYQTTRSSMHNYLKKKMDDVAPNLNAIIGERMGGRLIAHAGSLRRLAKAPASTVQIFGSEKALFRALKNKGKTPKFGILYNTPYITKASGQNKGRMSRFVANKVSQASRIDAFQDFPTSAYGEAFKDQIEEKLRFFENSAKVKFEKNVDIMARVEKQVKKDQKAAEKAEKKAEKKSKKRKRDDEEEDKGLGVTEEPPKKKKKKKDKKKKEKKEDAMEDEPAVEETPSKKKKKKKKKKEKKKAEKEEFAEPEKKDVMEDEPETPSKKKKKKKSKTPKKEKASAEETPSKKKKKKKSKTPKKEKASAEETPKKKKKKKKKSKTPKKE